MTGKYPFGAHARDEEPLLKTSLAFAATILSLSAPAVAADDSLTWNGVTLYGVVDIGMAYQTHGAPLSQDWMVGLQYLLAKSSNKPITSVAPNGLSQSRIGIRGSEQIVDSLYFVFNTEIGFNPQSGTLSDALKALTHNNGVPLDRQTSAGDSSRAGQLFNSQAYAGLSSKDWGTLTLGRHNTLLLDNIVKYDPMNGSYAFSPIGLSGTTCGGGDTEDCRLDGSIKYVFRAQTFHAGALYQPGKTDSSPGEAWQGNLGFEYAGFSIDGIYHKKKDAISAGSLSAAQVATAPINSLAATISDNESWTVAGSWTGEAFKVSGGYEHIEYKNPSLPLQPGFSGLGGYWIAFVNNTAFPRTKDFDVSWIGLKYALTKDFDLTGAWYHYDQDSYGVNKCSDASAGTCSGTLDAYSVRADYRFNKRFDVYAGSMWSGVYDGLANGYLHRNTLSTMVGFRFQF